MYLSNELKVQYKDDFNPEIRSNFIESLYYIIDIIIAKKNLFSLDDFNISYFDEFSLETNCHKDIFNTVFIEIDQPMNYKPSKKKKTIFNKNTEEKLTFPELYYTIEDFMEELFGTLVASLDSNNILWKEENAICLKTVSNIDNEIHNYYYRIIPCLTHYNKNNTKGQFYKKSGGLEITYNQLAIKNFNKKNKQTKGMYRDTILIFKNILLKDPKIKYLPTEIIETMLYNVPDNMFIDLNKKTLINIINYIRNNSIKNFKTLDEQDDAFISPLRSMSLLYVKHINKIIEKYLCNN